MISALESRVNWAKNSLFHSVPDYLVPDILSLCQSHCSSAFQETDFLMIRTVQDKFPDSLAEEFQIRPLSEEHSGLIVNNWKFSSGEFSEIWIRDQIRAGLGLGLFNSQDNQLVSWGLCYQ